MWPDIDGGDLNFPGLHIMGYLRQGPKCFAREEVTVRKQKRKVLGPAYSTYHGRVRIPMFVSPDSPAYAIIEPYFLPLWIVVVTVFMIGTISYLVIVKIYAETGKQR